MDFELLKKVIISDSFKQFCNNKTACWACSKPDASLFVVFLSDKKAHTVVRCAEHLVNYNNPIKLSIQDIFTLKVINGC